MSPFKGPLLRLEISYKLGKALCRNISDLQSVPSNQCLPSHTKLIPEPVVNPHTDTCGTSTKKTVKISFSMTHRCETVRSIVVFRNLLDSQFFPIYNRLKENLSFYMILLINNTTYYIN